MSRKSGWLTRIRNAITGGGGERITTPEHLERALRAGNMTAAGAVVSAQNALTVGAVYACIRILADSVGMCPLVLYRLDGRGRKTEAKDHPLWRLLKVRPNEWQTPYDFARMLMLHLLAHGNAYVVKSHLGRRLIDLIPLDPVRMSVLEDTETRWTYEYSRLDGSRQVYAASEIMHLRGLSWKNWLGVSTVMDAAREEIGIAMAARKQAGKVFAQGAQLAGYLKAPGNLTQEAITRLVEQFAEKYAGVDNAWKTPVLEEGLDFVKVSMTSEEAQLLESRKLSASDIAMCFGVPPHMIGQVEKATSWGSGIEQQSIGFMTYTLMPWFQNIAQHAHIDLLDEAEWDRYALLHDTEPLTRGDFKSLQEGLQIQRQNGVINADEWRLRMGMNPREDGLGDDYWMPSNMINASQPQQQKQIEAPNAPAAHLRLAAKTA